MSLETHLTAGQLLKAVERMPQEDLDRFVEHRAVDDRRRGGRNFDEWTAGHTLQRAAFRAKRRRDQPARHDRVHDKHDRQRSEDQHGETDEQGFNNAQQYFHGVEVYMGGVNRQDSGFGRSR